MICIPPFLAAGIAVSSNRLFALFPAPSTGRPKYVERKKFCMSIITSAVFEGEITTDVVVVDREMESLGDGRAYSGGAGRVRSKLGGDDEWSQ